MRIAVLHRNEAQRGQIACVLAQSGHTCVPFSDWPVLSKALAASTLDMLVLDWQGTRLSAPAVRKAVLKTARVPGGSQIPILFASEDTSEDSIVRAFAVGADDYVSLPVCPLVFGARVNALLRRAFPERYDDITLLAGPYRLDTRRQIVFVRGKPVALSGTQYRLALLFFANVGRVLSRRHIYTMVWGRDLCTPTRTIDSHVSRLRVLLDIDEPNGFQLEPVYRTGYRLMDLAHDAGAGESGAP